MEKKVKNRPTPYVRADSRPTPKVRYQEEWWGRDCVVGSAVLSIGSHSPKQTLVLCAAIGGKVP